MRRPNRRSAGRRSRQNGVPERAPRRVRDRKRPSASRQAPAPWLTCRRHHATLPSWSTTRVTLRRPRAALGRPSRPLVRRGATSDTAYDVTPLVVGTARAVDRSRSRVAAFHGGPGLQGRRRAGVPAHPAGGPVPLHEPSSFRRLRRSGGRRLGPLVGCGRPSRAALQPRSGGAAHQEPGGREGVRGQ